MLQQQKTVRRRASRLSDIFQFVGIYICQQKFPNILFSFQVPPDWPHESDVSTKEVSGSFSRSGLSSVTPNWGPIMDQFLGLFTVGKL